LKGGFNMPKLALLNQAGDNVGDIELQDSIFGIEPSQQALYEVVKAQRAAMRQGTHSTKTRGLVRGGGRKPWRQKGTGRARQGTIRAPQWVGGGVVFGPTPRSYIVKVNKKVRRLALKSALSSKVAEKQFFILDALNLDSPKTKEVVQVLNNLSLSGKVMIVLDKPNETVLLAARNIPGVTVRTIEQASVYELMNSHTLLATQDAVKKYEEVLG
jgi:large subunit ribosomal protein L4